MGPRTMKKAILSAFAQDLAWLCDPKYGKSRGFVMSIALLITGSGRRGNSKWRHVQQTWTFWSQRQRRVEGGSI